MPIPLPVLTIIKTLNDHDHQAFAVGGCVRDMYLGIEPNDWDIATSALPGQVKQIFPKTFDTGIEHGTVTVLFGKSGYEVTTYRIDGEYLDNRRPAEVVFTDNLTEDVKRRDFTINAMAYHPETGLVDPFGGLDDINNKIIRCVGDPNDRFKEDGLRMIRAVRFAAVTGFEIEKKTRNAIYNNAGLIQNISKERIRDEFVKIVTAGNPRHLSVLADSRLAGYISKEFGDYLTQQSVEIINDLLKCDKSLVLCFSIFFRFLSTEDVKKMMRFFRFDNITIKYVSVRIAWLDKLIDNDDYSVRKTLSIIGQTALDDILYLKKIVNSETSKQIAALNDKKNRVIRNADCISLKSLAVTGADILEHTEYRGKQIGDVLAYLLEIVLRNPDKNNKEELIKFARKYFTPAPAASSPRRP